jgi:hypothetical protein
MALKRKKRGTMQKGIRQILDTALRDMRVMKFKGSLDDIASGSPAGHAQAQDLVRALLHICKDLVVKETIPRMLAKNLSALTICVEAVLNPSCCPQTLAFDTASPRTKWKWDIRPGTQQLTLFHYAHLAWVKDVLERIRENSRIYRYCA